MLASWISFGANYDFKKEESTNGGNLGNELIDSANKLVLCIRRLTDINRERDIFPVIVYFDEAQTLCDIKWEGKGDLYTSLMRVLTILTLTETPIFFIFLSTNSRLSTLAPTSAAYPSARIDKSGKKLVPPVFTLPFDDHYRVGDLKHPPTLDHVCSLEHISKAGRLA